MAEEPLEKLDHRRFPPSIEPSRSKSEAFGTGGIGTATSSPATRAAIAWYAAPVGVVARNASGSPRLVVTMISGSSAIDAEQRQPQNPVDVLDGEHLSFAHELRPQSIDDELRPKPIAEQTDDAIDIAYGGDFGRADDDRLVGAGDRVLEAELDAGGAVDQRRNRSARASARRAPAS